MVERLVFQEFFAKCSAKQRYLIDSKSSGEYLFSLSQKYNFSKETDIILCRTVSAIVLGFYKIEDTVPLLQQELGLDPKTAALLGAEVLEFLAPLSDPNWVPPVETEDNDYEESGGAGAIAVAAEPEISRVPLKSPAITINQLHTLASDMAAVRSVGDADPYSAPAYETGHGSRPAPSEQIPVYQSTQPTPTTTPLSTIPSYTPPPTPPAPTAPAPAPDRPRWSTEI